MMKFNEVYNNFIVPSTPIDRNIIKNNSIVVFRKNTTPYNPIAKKKPTEKRKPSRHRKTDNASTFLRYSRFIWRSEKCESLRSTTFTNIGSAQRPAGRPRRNTRPQYPCACANFFPTPDGLWTIKGIDFGARSSNAYVRSRAQVFFCATSERSFWKLGNVFMWIKWDGKIYWYCCFYPFCLSLNLADVFTNIVNV